MMQKWRLQILTLAFAISSVLACSHAHAQFSVIEYDTVTRFRFLGNEWAPSFFSLASLETDKMKEGGRLSTYNYFTFSAFMGEQLRLRVRVPFSYSTAGTDRRGGSKVNKAELAMQDLIVGLQSSNFWLVPWDIGTYWEGRVYLPTSDHSREIGQIARLRNELILTKMITRPLGLEYDQKFSYYIQSRKASQVRFEDELGFPVEVTSLTKTFELDHWLNLYYRLGQSTSLGWKIGEEVTGYNKSAEMDRSKPEEHLIKTGPSLRFATGKTANFLLSFEDKVNRDDRSQLGRFMAENTEFTLLSFISF